MSIEVIAIGSDNLVRLDGLTNFSTGVYINNATVSFTLTDANGNVVLNNVAMSYVASSNGRYEGVIPNTSTSTFTVGAYYTIAITATGGGFVLYRRLSCIAKYRSNQ